MHAYQVSWDQTIGNSNIWVKYKSILISLTVFYNTYIYLIGTHMEQSGYKTGDKIWSECPDW